MFDLFVCVLPKTNGFRKGPAYIADVKFRKTDKNIMKFI